MVTALVGLVRYCSPRDFQKLSIDKGCPRASLKLSTEINFIGLVTFISEHDKQKETTHVILKDF
jgi:hypothetical protein